MKIRLASLLFMAFCLTLATEARAGVLYQNGPVNGICDIQNCQVDAWTVNFGFGVSDTFTVASNSTITGANFAFWMSPGDTLTSLDWEVGTVQFSNDVASGTASGANLTQTFMFTNQYGYDINLISISGLNVPVDSGITYWLTLQNATVASGDPVYWDENNGPSEGKQAFEGTIPSESFNIIGNSGTGSTPEPGAIVLFSSGVVGLGTVLRRKLHRSS
jgi:hypothetical protein